MNWAFCCDTFGVVANKGQISTCAYVRMQYLCSQVNAGVHRTYSMFVKLLEKSPNKRVGVGIILYPFCISFLVCLG